MAKHLIIIHGRSTKPPEEEKRRLTMTALLAGLRRVNVEAAEAIEQSTVKVSFVYYGDINNRIIVNADPRQKERMVPIDGNWYKQPGSYDTDLQRLLDRPTDRHTEGDYRQLLREVRDLRFVDDLVRLASPALNLFGLNMKVLRRLFPDMAAYLTSRVIGSEIRQRLQEPLYQAFKADDDVALVAHSMGAYVSYDVLWKFSRMSEYKEIHDKKLSLWITIGSPLGEPGIIENLYDADEPEDGKYPTNILRWTNISAVDDFIAADFTIADDFNEMKRKGLIGDITDTAPIYNFWVDSDGSNPHKFYGYLNHSVFAEHLNQWVMV
jgi:hypothetical protein